MRDGQLRKEESHSVRLWGCERKKQTQGGGKSKKKRQGIKQPCLQLFYGTESNVRLLLKQ